MHLFRLALWISLISSALTVPVENNETHIEKRGLILSALTFIPKLIMRGALRRFLRGGYSYAGQSPANVPGMAPV